MKTFLYPLVFISTLAFVLGAPNDSEIEFAKKEEAATQKCNATYPVTEDPRQKIGLAVLSGQKLSVGDPAQWCHLRCFLEEVGFFNAEGNMQTKKIFDYAMKSNPELASHSDVFIIQLYMINRSTKIVEDKCKKAFICFKQFIESAMVCQMAKNLNEDTHVREKFMEAASNGKEMPNELRKEVKNYIEMMKLWLE